MLISLIYICKYFLPFCVFSLLFPSMCRKFDNSPIIPFCFCCLYFPAPEFFWQLFSYLFLFCLYVVFSVSSCRSLSIFKTTVLNSFSSNSTIWSSLGTIFVYFSFNGPYFPTYLHILWFFWLLLKTGHLNCTVWLILWITFPPFNKIAGLFILDCYRVSLAGLRASQFFSECFLNFPEHKQSYSLKSGPLKH